MRILKQIRAFILFIIVSILIGTLVGAMFIPIVYGGKYSVSTMTSAWDEMPHTLPKVALPQTSTMLDANGKVIAYFYSENRTNVMAQDISPAMKDTIVSVEDKRFYEHNALDLQGTLRAFIQNMASSSTQGGSTLTQQYVKNVLFYNAKTPEEQKEATEQTYARKLKELRLAVEVEKTMTKEEILAGYLNIANFGDGAFGIEAAAQHYFSVSAKELTIPQSAVLAGIVKNPSLYNPVTNPHDAENRRNTVFSLLVANNVLTPEQAETLSEQPIKLDISKTRNGCYYSAYPFYCQEVMKTVLNSSTFGDTEEARQALLDQGLVITTNLQPGIQKTINRVSQEALGTENQYATASAVVEPGTGRILGIGSNREYGNGKGKTQITLATSGFQNGSTFKPITLMAALKNGWDMDRTINSSSSWCAPYPNVGCFSNMGGTSYGRINATTAFEYSANTFFTQLSVITGTKNVQNMTRDLGVPLPKNLTGFETATTLGVYDVSPVQLSNVYATIAAKGEYCTPTWISKVKTVGGKEIDVPQGNCKQVINRNQGEQVAHALTQVIDGNNPARTGKNMSLGRPALGKTGTTDNSSAVWFAGAVPQYAMATWVGDPRGGFKYPITNLELYGDYISSAYGSTAAGPIWKNIMQDITDDVPPKGF